MTTFFLRTLVPCAVLLLAPLTAASTIHVDAQLVTGLNDGSSWSNAFQGSAGLQSALALATTGDEIFAAQGTYRPTETGSRTVAFALKNGVTLYGSFAGGESSAAERPPFGTADSILDGDLAGNDGSLIFTDNSFHVITATPSNATAIIDGFVVRAGAATSSGGNRDRGAGILCVSNASPTVRNCRFLAHRSSFGGAAGYINNGAAPTFTDCTFEDGIGGSFGGAFDIAGGGAARFERCLFANNTAARAGALEIFSTNGVVVNNCVFRSNVATGSGGGGGMWMGTGGNTQVRNCTFVANASQLQASGGLRTQSSANSSVSNCIFWDNMGPGGSQSATNQVNGNSNVDYSLVEGGFTGTGVGNIDGDPQFTNLLSNDFSLTETSPAIDAADNTAVPSGSLVDFSGSPRLADVLAVADTGVGAAPVVDMGAFEAPSAWIDLGQSLAGGPGAPVLIMSGDLSGGSMGALSLSNALPSSTAFLVAGLTLLQAPLKGGILVPSADLILNFPTTASGTLDFAFTWPLGIPAGVSTYYQVWLADAAGPVGFSASQGIQGTTP
ncbi:MAG: hypothetical protein ACI9EF_001054 [Pseudohongiellaceae bacterium]|jgi:hypothetical protein